MGLLRNSAFLYFMKFLKNGKGKSPFRKKL